MSKSIGGGGDDGGSSGASARTPGAAARHGRGEGFGNASTKVSFEERSRRNRALRAAAAPFIPAAHARGGSTGLPSGAQAAKLAAFPEESRLPGGGYYVEEGPDDALPPPSDYEVREAAYMMRVYNEMMERLRTTGVDTGYPGGYAPKIYDLTGGGC